MKYEKTYNRMENNSFKPAVVKPGRSLPFIRFDGDAEPCEVILFSKKYRMGLISFKNRKEAIVFLADNPDLIADKNIIVYEELQKGFDNDIKDRAVARHWKMNLPKYLVKLDIDEEFVKKTTEAEYAVSAYR